MYISIICSLLLASIAIVLTVQAQTSTQYNSQPWFVQVFEVPSTIKSHLVQTSVDFTTWRYQEAIVLVENTGDQEQACQIQIRLNNINNATIAHGDLPSTDLIQPGLTAEYTIPLTWTGTANITESRVWFIGTIPITTQP